MLGPLEDCRYRWYSCVRVKPVCWLETVQCLLVSVGNIIEHRRSEMTPVPFTALVPHACERVCWLVCVVLSSELSEDGDHAAPVCGAHQSLWHVLDAQEVLTGERKELSRPGKGPRE